MLADSELRLKIAAQYPDKWSRIQQRRSMVTKTFGIELHDEAAALEHGRLLPAVRLAPQLAMVRT